LANGLRLLFSGRFIDAPPRPAKVSGVFGDRAKAVPANCTARSAAISVHRLSERDSINCVETRKVDEFLWFGLGGTLAPRFLCKDIKVDQPIKEIVSGVLIYGVDGPGLEGKAHESFEIGVGNGGVVTVVTMAGFAGGSAA
jgi:hypothetical protein